MFQLKNFEVQFYILFYVTLYEFGELYGKNISTSELVMPKPRTPFLCSAVSCEGVELLPKGPDLESIKTSL